MTRRRNFEAEIIKGRRRAANRWLAGPENRNQKLETDR
jgi:hypothetical protein